jgi:GAF domain-containing protein
VTEPDLLATMGALARDLHERNASLEDMLSSIVAAAVVNVPGATSAGISVETGRRKLESRATTGDVPAVVADAQSDVGEGPCLESIAAMSTVRVDDLTGENRWPALIARIAAAPIVSMLSVPLFVGGRSFGSLSLYSPDKAAFDEQSEAVCAVLASHAAVALAGAQNQQGLRLALDNRDVIGQAKGILMERHKITGQDAFMLLVRVSQTSNVRLADVAEHLVASGELRGT